MEEQTRIAVLRGSIQQDATALQRLHWLAMARKPLFQHLIIGIGRRRGKRCAAGFQLIPTGNQIVTGKGNVLNALPIIEAQKFLNLTTTPSAFFIQRNANFAIGRGHRARREARIFALNVKIADFAEVKDALIKAGPMVHSAAINIVRQVIDQL